MLRHWMIDINELECQQYNCTRPAQFGFSAHPKLCYIQLLKGMASISDMHVETEKSSDYFSPEKNRGAKTVKGLGFIQKSDCRERHSHSGEKPW